MGQSPQWLANRLTQLGMRPINALVDISNYVMLELGQPNHPYDLALVPGGGFRVRRGRDGEALTTLDDVERRVSVDDLLICGADDTPIGIAGVMGGASCEISASTTDVLLEMAWFRPMAISRTSRRLGLRTEASARFDKGCDPEVIDLAADRFCQLAAEICGATTAPGAVDVRGELPDRSPVRVRTARVNAILGTDLDASTIAGHLESIGFTTTPVGTDHDVVIPSWRYDSSAEIDVIEEVARLHGYSRITPEPLPSSRTGRLTERQLERRALRGAMVGMGLAEAMPLPFLAPGELTRCGLPDEGISLVNPLVADESVLRTSLLPGLVQAVAHNATRRQLGVGLFEIGHVFRPPPADQLLPDERECLAAIRAGLDAEGAVAAWQVVADTLAVADATVVNAEVPGLHPTRSGHIVVAGEVVGELGEIDPEVLARHDIGERVAWLQVDLTRLLALPHGERPYRLVSRFPSSDIDLAFDVADAVPVHRGRGHRRARPPPTCSTRSSCSTCSAARPWATGAAAWRSPCGSRPPTAPSPTTRCRACARPSSPRSSRPTTPSSAEAGEAWSQTDHDGRFRTRPRRHGSGQEVEQQLVDLGRAPRAASSGRGRRCARSATGRSTYSRRAGHLRLGEREVAAAPHAHGRRLDRRQLEAAGRRSASGGDVGPVPVEARR